MASKLLAELRQIFTFAYSRELVKMDPTYAIKKKEISGVEKPRERVLSRDEIRELAELPPASGLGTDPAAARFTLLPTGPRVGGPPPPHRGGGAVRPGQPRAQPCMRRPALAAPARASPAGSSTRADIGALVAGRGKVQTVFR